MIKRMTQPPAPSWKLWDPAMPESVFYESMTREEWDSMSGDPRLIQAAVRDRLAQAGEKLLAQNAALADL